MVTNIEVLIIIWTLICEALAVIFHENANDDQNNQHMVKADTCHVAKGPRMLLFFVISLPCFEVSSQLDFEPVLIQFLSPVTFSAQSALVAVCV